MVHYYQCKKCKHLTMSSSKPTLKILCSDGKIYSHNWVQKDEIGDTEYQCKKCGNSIKVKLKAKSDSYFCSTSGYCTWNKV